MASPDGALRAVVGLDADGSAWYQLFRGSKPVIQKSPLGVDLHNTAFESGLRLKDEPDVVLVNDRYRLWTGKQKLVEYRANQLEVPLRNAEGHGLVMTFRLSDDGLAYRYSFTGRSEDPRVVTSELSGVQFFPGTKAWLQPKAEAQSGWMNTNPSYEEDYLQAIDIGTPSPTESGWVYPALFSYENTWIVLSETGMDGRYAGTNLAQDSPEGPYSIRFPQEAEVITNGKRLPEARLPFHSPWRLVLAGDLATIVESTLGTDLAVPARLDETDFIRPGPAVWSWGLLKDESVVYPVQKEFVDYAARMTWPYALVDVNWDANIGYQKIAQLADYAANKGVGLLLWYNSSGAWNQTVYRPKSRLLTRADRRAEFSRLQEMGIRGVKVDFFPGDGRSVIRYYLDILEDAADHELLVNFHGATLPRGMHRTWPNLMTVEAVKGFEMVTFFQEFADLEATHAAMLPFTRNLFDPMDFTPMVLGDIPNIERRTSNGFQLALTVLFTSGIQHLVTTPEQMEAVPEFVHEYLRDLPGQWDESRFLAGYPGKFVVLVRRAANRWYVAGINAEEQAREFELDLSFIPVGPGRLIVDGKTQRSFQLREATAGQQQLTLQPGTGFVMTFDHEDL